MTTAEFSLDAWFWLSIGAILVLVVLSGFFSGSETALTAASKPTIHQLEKSGDRRARIVWKLIQARERLIGSLLLGNNLVNILASSLATSIFIRLFGEIGIVYTTIVMTVLVLIFAEILPKTWAILAPNRFALKVAPLVRLVVFVFGYVVAMIEWLVFLLLKPFGVEVGLNMAILSAHDELRGAVDLKHTEGSLVKEERDRLDGVLDLSDLEVSDVMIHRTETVGIDADGKPDEAVKQVLDSMFSRLPVWRGSKDNVIGILHAKDLLREISTNGIPGLDIGRLAKEPWFVPDTTSLEVQLNAFLKRKSHFALVVDEYGEVMGHVTLEDILEEIVGEISDEHDVPAEGIMQQEDGSVIVHGSVTVRDLMRATDWELPDEEFATVAGLVIHEAQMIPDADQVFTFHGFRFAVLEKDRNRMVKLMVSPETGKELKE